MGKHAIAFIVAFGVLVHGAAIGADFEPFPAGGQPRDAVLNEAATVAFVAVYDACEVRQIDLKSGETLASIPVGKGPSALALASDQSVLACVNRLSGDTSLIRMSDLHVYATVPCGDGPCAVAALPGGGFAVANSFSDTVTLITPARPELTANIKVPGSVPNVVAATDRLLVVATRVPASLYFYEGGADTPVADLALPSPAVAAVSLGGDRLVVATKEELLAVDAASREIVARRELSTADLAVSGSDMVVLKENTVVKMGFSLEPSETLALDGSAGALSVSGNTVLVFAPREQTAWIHMPKPAPVVAETPPPQPEPVAVAKVEESPAPAVEEAPAPEPTSEAEPEEEAWKAEKKRPASPAEAPQEKPAEEPAEVEAQATLTPPEEKAPEPTKPAEAPAPEPAAPATEEEPVEVAKAAPAPSEDIKPTATSYRRVPLGTAETRAPSPADRRPGASPMTGVPSPSLDEALASSLELREGLRTFAGIDWINAPLEAEDELVLSKGGQHMEASGNVVLREENAMFHADRLIVDQETGVTDAIGNVWIAQPDFDEPISEVQADSIRYTLGADTELETPTPLAEAVGGGPSASGRIEASNLEVTSPQYRLKAESLDYDFLKETGEITNVRANSGVLYIGATKVRLLGPASADGEYVWVTTCDRDPPHYRIRLRRAVIEEGKSIVGTHARMEVGKFKTPLYWPRWGHVSERQPNMGFEIDSGRRAEIGYFVNVAQYFAVTPEIDIGVRLFPTTKEGIGFGLETDYDFMQSPSSPLFRGRGSARGLITTEERGHLELYHRQETSENTVLLLQAEQWTDREFNKDFYYDEYKDRTEPRTFANLTLTKPAYLASATVRQTTNNFVTETERAPELTYHLLERPLTDDLYLTVDSIAGYNEREPVGTHALRSINVARLSLDVDLTEAWNLTPFVELEGSWYSDGPRDAGSNTRLSSTLGSTLQTRYHRSFGGKFGFSGFKHIIVPSVTISYRPKSTMDVEDTPRFDAYDNVYGRSRIESKIANILFGRDAETGEVWQVGRLTLYQGTDFWNEMRRSEDYELELDVRPRPWWGFQTAAEHHSITGDFDIDQPYPFERAYIQITERFMNRILDRPYDTEKSYRYNARYGDYDRMLAYLYYDDRFVGGKLNGRLGFAYTRTQEETFNREILYGLGYRLNENWGVAFEHCYDLERSDLYRQKYEIRRNLHCWEAALLFRDRASGWDIGFELSLTAFPSTKVRF